MLQLSTQRSGELVILQCTGKVVAGEDLKRLQKAATAQRAAGLVIDFQGVVTLDAAGLGVLLRVRQWCNSQKMTLKLIHLNKRVRELLALTALDSVIEIHPPETEDEFQDLLRDWACAES